MIFSDEKSIWLVSHQVLIDLVTGATVRCDPGKKSPLGLIQAE